MRVGRKPADAAVVMTARAFLEALSARELLQLSATSPTERLTIEKLGRVTPARYSPLPGPRRSVARVVGELRDSARNIAMKTRRIMLLGETPSDFETAVAANDLSARGPMAVATRERGADFAKAADIDGSRTEQELARRAFDLVRRSAGATLA